MTEPTARPWKATFYKRPTGGFDVTGSGGELVLICPASPESPEKDRANMGLAMGAVNSHDALVEACTPIITEARSKADFENSTWAEDAHVELTVTIAECRAMEAALALARGEETT